MAMAPKVWLGLCDGIKEDVVTKANGCMELGEAVSQPSVILVCASRNCSFTSSFFSNKISQELILLGRGAI
jgi:hypothetical protein